MKKLEEEVSKIGRLQNYESKKPMHEKINDLLKKEGSLIVEKAKQLNEEFILKQDKLADELMAVSLLMTVYNHGGWIKISQDLEQKHISDFSSLEDLILERVKFSAHIDKPAPNLGEAVYRVCENRILNFVNANRDSSD